MKTIKKNGGHTVRFNCDDVNMLIGNPIRECLSNGKWSGSNAKCKRKQTFLTYCYLCLPSYKAFYFKHKHNNWVSYF